MSFEEEFPSFKKHQYMYFRWTGPPDNQFLAVPAIHQRDIQEHCIDKQRVREAIEKLYHINEYDWEYIAIPLLKELNIK